MLVWCRWGYGEVGFVVAVGCCFCDVVVSDEGWVRVGKGRGVLDSL